MKCIRNLMEKYEKGLLIEHDENLLFQTIADQDLCAYLPKSYRENLIRLVCKRRVSLKKEATC